MITKLTAQNSGLYYAPAFELINQALEAAGKSLRIYSIEDYFNNLTTDIIPLLVNRHSNGDDTFTGIPGGYLLLMPADEEIFEIDANTRMISIPAHVKKNGVGVYGDHNAEMLVLNIDRYFDNQDLLNTNVAINWTFTPAGSKTSGEVHAVPAFAPNADLNPEKVTFGFIINNDMTTLEVNGKKVPTKGVLTFSVTFYTTKSGEIDYSFNTLTASVNINETLSLTDTTIIPQNPIEYFDNNFLGRFTNSVYQDSTISPVGIPVWKSGILNDDGTYSGLMNTLYLKPNEDITNNYATGEEIKVYALSNPATADMVYNWTFMPLDGNIAMNRTNINTNKNSTYLLVDPLPENDNGELYYVKDAMGRYDTLHPRTLEQAKTELAEAENDNLEFLALRIKKLITAPNDLNKEKSQFNQDHLVVLTTGNKVITTSTQELEVFQSTNPQQGSGKWIGFDIDTGLDSIIGVKWNGFNLTEDDVAEAASVGLGAGHIVFWAKANEIQITPKQILLMAEGYKTTKFTVCYDGVDSTHNSVDTYVNIINEKTENKYYVRGSALQVFAAGKYQVTAQARIEPTNNYELIQPGVELKVGVNYYKKVNNSIDSEHPLINAEAQEAKDNGEELYVLVTAARNSEIATSSVLTIPPAIKPTVHIHVDENTLYKFNDTIIKDEEFNEVNYTYIDESSTPTIIADISIESNNADDSKGAFASELIGIDTPDLDKDSIENGNYEFVSLEEINNKTFSQLNNITTGKYLVRVINRRNNTYSVAKSDIIETSYVAPEDTQITVKAVPWKKDTPQPTTGFIPVLINGERPENEENKLGEVTLTRVNPRYLFKIEDNTEFDENKYDIDKLVKERSYWVEEVDYNEETGEVTPRDLSGIDPITKEKYDKYDNPEPDLREVITDNDGNLFFTIEDDSGYYRIRVITKYHGTTRINYTKDIFNVKSS